MTEFNAYLSGRETNAKHFPYGSGHGAEFGLAAFIRYDIYPYNTCKA